MTIEPLRKRKGSGELYTRRPPTIDFIEESLRWPFDDLLARAAIRDRRHDDYVPSEVLVYHLRQTKSDNTDGRFVAIYNVLRDRVEAACPRANRNVGDKIYEDARIAQIRDATIDHVTELMFKDRQDYDEQLDIYEVVFDKAVRLARITKLRKVNRKENANEEVEDAVTGEDLGSSSRRDLKRSSVNNGLRNHIRTALAMLSLADPDPAVRRAAVDQIIDNFDAGNTGSGNIIQTFLIAKTCQRS